jgi:hypothetical protein
MVVDDFVVTHLSRDAAEPVSSQPESYAGETAAAPELGR